jgi:hypothetical protein
MIFYVILLFILVFGLITSYDDVKHGLIRNKWVLFAIAFGIIVILVDVLILGGKFNSITSNPILEFFTNLLFTLAVGFLIWYIGLWSAGDAKLFVAFASIVPLNFYIMNYTRFFPSLTLMINTFAPIFIVMLFYLLFKNPIKTHISALKMAFNPKTLGMVSLFVLGFSWPVTLFLNWIGIQANFFIVIALLFILISVLTKIFNIKLLYASLFLTFLRLIFNYKLILTIPFLKNIILSIFVLIFLRFYLIALGYNVFSYEIFLEDLSEGMLLAEDIVKKGKKYEKVRHIHMSFIGALMIDRQKDSILDSLPDGLTNDEIKEIKKLHSRGALKSHKIRIYKIFPFAPFMFLGVLITLLLKGNVIDFLINLF